jgi:3-oxoacyl-ACP reductase-like protein
MGMLSNIFNKIFPNSNSAKQAQAQTQAQTQAQAQAPRPTTAGAPAPAAPAPAQAPAPAAMDEVDVEAILNSKLQASGQQLNWRTSIVDLLKLLDIDSSLQARKELAAELHYTGDTSDSASMNIWLHKQVMNKLAANGGKVPADLRD